MTTDDDFDDIDAWLHEAAQHAIDAVPDKPMPPAFFEILGGASPRDRRRSRRYGLVAAAVAAAVALFFAFRPDDPSSTSDTAAPPTSSDPAPTTEPERITVEAQIEIDTSTAAALGITIGQIVFDEADGAPSDQQPDLVPVVDTDGTLVGYSPPESVLGGDAYTVYGPDGTTIRGEFDAINGFTPNE